MEGPLLWAVQELAAPLEARLRHHFASGLPTDRPDRPEWLFATALRVAREAGPQLAPLQPALAVPVPGLVYDIQVRRRCSLLCSCVRAHENLRDPRIPTELWFVMRTLAEQDDSRSPQIMADKFPGVQH